MGEKNNPNEQYPAITLSKMVVFPTEKTSLVLEGKEIIDTVEKVHQNNHLVVLLFRIDEERSKIGVVAKILQHWDLIQSVRGLIVEGIKRVEVMGEHFEEGVKMVNVREVAAKTAKGDEAEVEALSRNAFEQFRKVIQTEGIVPLMIIDEIQKGYISPERTTDIVAAVLKLDFPEKITLLETFDIKKRLEILKEKLSKELNIAEAEKKIEERVEKDVEETQKEFILKERLKAIEKELGITEEQKEYEELENKIQAAGLPQEAKDKIMGELRRLKQMPAISPEISYIRTYLEWIADLPWSKKSETNLDLKRARQVLDEDHYGLDRAKERVLEYLAVQKLTEGKGKATILCFTGPPGTGKTSVGQSIARAVGRKFVRISLGGIRDEAEIRGHRRTYVGALPGRIIQGMRDAGTKNPVFMMDEIDKIGADFRGDPSAALLEALDPAQNHVFSDHYIEIPFDLSEVLFITTANILDPIPPALQDRMEVIEFPGYTDEEKFHIARLFLFPRVLKSTGIKSDQLDFKDEAIRKTIGNYTREAGVRELERKLSDVARKIAKQVAEGELKKPATITKDNLSDFLGPEEYEVTMREKEDEVGVATGLAWTPVGGEIMFIEATCVPGKGNLTLTGQLGDVMQESARAALSYIRSRSRELHFPEDFYYKSDIHVHVPSGAIPKDGPSAGIAIATAIASMLTGKKVKKDIALTGEVTLSGKVLEVGGVKEKVLAAQRADVRTIVLPDDNKKNLVDIPDEVKKKLDFLFVNHMDEVVDIALRK
jgi:ATP-dependent Lon protease